MIMRQAEYIELVETGTYLLWAMKIIIQNLIKFFDCPD